MIRARRPDHRRGKAVATGGAGCRREGVSGRRAGAHAKQAVQTTHDHDGDEPKALVSGEERGPDHQDSFR